MSDPAVLAQQVLEPAAYGMAVAARFDQDVRGQGGLSGADRPHVQVVNLHDLRLLGEFVADRIGVMSGGGGFQEDPARVAYQPVPRPGHQRVHDERGDGVGAVEAGQQDDQRGHGGADEGEQVVQDVLVGALDIERGAVGPGDAPGRRDVDDDARERRGDHRSALDRGWTDEPAGRPRFRLTGLLCARVSALPQRHVGSTASAVRTSGRGGEVSEVRGWEGCANPRSAGGVPL